MEKGSKRAKIKLVKQILSFCTDICITDVSKDSRR